MAIVTIPELSDSLSNLFEVAEDAAMDRLLLQGPIEALGYAVGLENTGSFLLPFCIPVPSYG